MARKLASIWVPIILLLTFLTTVYFKQWFLTARAIRTVQAAQRADIDLLADAKNSLQDILSQQIALRMKLFGPESAAEAVLSNESTAQPAVVLPPSVVSAMKRHAVRLVFYKQPARAAGLSRAQIQFEGNFDDLVRFLSAVLPDMPKMDEFEIERAAAGAV